MPKIQYIHKTFKAESRAMVEQANKIIAEYTAQGYRLTLRQLYYQFVARDLIPNKQREYKRLGDVINDARLAGLVDWEAIEDRTRNLAGLPHWSSPASILEACAHGFNLDRWETQPYRVEVWIEKEALAGVFQRVCEDYDVPYFSCRGYTSQSEMWGASMRFARYAKNRQPVVILHFGDHDPSGIDMTRDIQDRMGIFNVRIDVRRLALNMPQVERYSPPPNPAKATDSRFKAYIRTFGTESWELDALEPRILTDLVRHELEQLIEPWPWEERTAQQAEHRRLLVAASSRWPELVKTLGA